MAGDVEIYQSFHMKSVTIGIPAHNEERNLPFLLESIVQQERSGFELERVIIACDGCTDRTAEVALGCAGRISGLEVINDGKRMGQAARIDQMIRLTKSDVYVSLDADTVLGSPKSLASLIAEFSDPTVGLVAAADRPHPARVFFESVAVTVVDLWRSVRTRYNGGDTIHNAHGCALAMSRHFIDGFSLPTGTNGADNFLYLKAKELQMGFRYASGAVVLYHEPMTLREYIAQRQRFHNIHGNMERIFGDWINKYYAPVPKSLMLQSIWRMFLERPILTPLALLLEVYSRLFIHTHLPAMQGGVWQTIQSTK